MGWQIMDVPNRTYIRWHIGNRVRDLNGCVAVGMKHGLLGGEDAVLSSREAFDIFMKKMEAFSEWEVEVKKADWYDSVIRS